MNRNWYSEAPAFFPYGVKPRVVDRDQLSRFISISQTEILQLLQAARTASDRIIELSHHFLAEIGVVNFAEVDLFENDRSTARIGLHHLVDHMLQLLVPHASQDHHGLDVRRVHDLDRALRRHMIGVDAHRVILVIVNVDHIKFGAVDFVF